MWQLWQDKLALKVLFICFWFRVVSEGVKDETAVDWWCDETECFYSDTIPREDKCDSNKTIPYRYNSTTGTCELNLLGLLLSFRVLNNRLGAVVEEKNRKRSEIIFRGIIYSGKVFAIFASVCVFVGCLYCFWVQYSDQQLRKGLKILSKRVQAHQTDQTNKTKQILGKEEYTPRCKTIKEEFQVSVV